MASFNSTHKLNGTIRVCFGRQVSPVKPSSGFLLVALSYIFSLASQTVLLPQAAFAAEPKSNPIVSVQINDLKALSESGIVAAPGSTDKPFFSAFPNCAPAAVNASTPGSSDLDSSAESSQSSTPGALKGGVSSDVHKHFATNKHVDVEHRRLDNGTLVISKAYDTVVDTLMGPIKIDGGSVVLIVSSPKNVVVYDLHDDHKNAVVFDYKTVPITLIPGHAAAITNTSFKSFEEVNPAPFVQYRHVANNSLDDRHQCFQAEFYIISLIRGLPALNALIHDDDAEARKRMDSMLKTTAIMLQLTNNSDPFSYYLTPALRELAIKSAK